jgi:hypothetical protein
MCLCGREDRSMHKCIFGSNIHNPGVASANDIGLLVMRRFPHSAMTASCFALQQTCKLTPSELNMNCAGRCAVLPQWASNALSSMGVFIPGTSTPSIVACPTPINRLLFCSPVPCASKSHSLRHWRMSASVCTLLGI